MPNILFLCTANSCRSQMAEALANHHFAGSQKYKFFSAGTKKSSVNTLAKEVIEELGIDISKQYSKDMEDLEDIKMDFVFTVCNHAHENCPYYPHGKILHHGFDDPPFLAKDINDNEERLKIYRRVRDEIYGFIKEIETHLN